MLHTITPEDHGPLGSAMEEAVRTCVHCGFCLAACPTYQELGQEADSPRGRILLMKSVLEGDLELEQALPHVDQCLGCLACETACPSGVPYRNLISPFRAIVNDKRERGLMEKLRRSMVTMTLPKPGVFRMAATMAKISKPLHRFAPASFKPMLELLPDELPPAQTWKKLNYAQGEYRNNPKARVALLIGCAQQVLDPDINTATIEVITKNGVEVHIPEAQGCCGALSWHVGDLATAQKFAKNNVKAFPDDLDAIITNAAGCGSGLHEYDLILRGTELEQQADAFRHKVMDVTAFLAKLSESHGLAPISDSGKTVTIAYHDACHLSHAQGVTAEPRALLSKIPGVTVAEVQDGHLCCGSAGTYNIDQPEIANSLGQKKATNILATNPDLVATGNIGCLTQIKNHITKQGKQVAIKHTIQIIRDAYMV